MTQVVVFSETITNRISLVCLFMSFDEEKRRGLYLPIGYFVVLHHGSATEKSVFDGNVFIQKCKSGAEGIMTASRRVKRRRVFSQSTVLGTV